MSIKNILFYFLFLISYAQTMGSSFVMNDNCIKAYHRIISLRIDEGKALLEKEKTDNPSNDIPYFLENYIDFITLFISEDKASFKKLKDNMDIRLQKMKKGDENSPYYLYTQADIYLQWALVRIKFREYFTAAIEIEKAYKLLTENKKRFPQFMADNKGLGLLHAISGAIPENYKWVAKLVGVKGTINQGVAELKELLSNINTTDFKYLHDEVFFILVMVEWNLQKDEEEALKLMQHPDFNESNNPFLVLAKAKIAMKTGNNDEAINVLKDRPLGKEYYPFHYLIFMTGIAKLNRLEVESAACFVEYINRFQGVNYIKTSWQKLAWISLMAYDSSGYKSLISHCIDAGDDAVDEDKDALKEAKTKDIPNIMLLKARLLCDGGYYEKSVEQIAGMKAKDFPRLKDQLEVTYRMARIYHLTKDFSKAIEYYEMTMANGMNSSYYFAANSALQLALIYERKDEKDKAIQYYKACLKMRNHDYQNSIDQKAEAGLNRLQ